MDGKTQIPAAVETQARRFCEMLGVNSEVNLPLIAAGITAITEAFRVSPEALELNSVFFRELKPPFMREVDGVEMVMSVEKSMGRFMDSDSASALTQIYLVSVADWLLLLLRAKWQSE
jgi:hypothetical protein